MGAIANWIVNCTLDGRMHNIEAHIGSDLSRYKRDDGIIMR